MRPRHLIVLLAIAAASPAPAVGATRARAHDLPVYFVHGWNLHSASDCAMWDTMRRRFRAWGSTGAHRTLGYYDADRGCNTIVTADGAHANDTPIEHLAADLAWDVYGRYSRRGQPIDVVAHSMGGLMIRYALAATERHDRAFPPYLRVKRVVTLGTPHGGTRVRAPGVEGGQFEAGSALLTWLERNGWEPDGRGGTDWLTIGSDADDAVAADRAAATDVDRRPANRYMGSSHKVWYTAVDGIGHADYLTRDRSDRTALAYETAAPGAFGSAVPRRTLWPVRRAFVWLFSGR
jgi:hypothetical protein